MFSPFAWQRRAWLPKSELERTSESSYEGSVRQVVRETGASIGTTAAVRKVLVDDGAL